MADRAIITAWKDFKELITAASAVDTYPRRVPSRAGAEVRSEREAFPSDQRVRRGSSPTPVRFDPPVADRLASYVSANPGMSLSSAANRLVDEALRMRASRDRLPDRAYWPA